MHNEFVTSFVNNDTFKMNVDDFGVVHKILRNEKRFVNNRFADGKLIRVGDNNDRGHVISIEYDDIDEVSKITQDKITIEPFASIDRERQTIRCNENVYEYRTDNPYNVRIKEVFLNDKEIEKVHLDQFGRARGIELLEKWKTKFEYKVQDGNQTGLVNKVTQGESIIEYEYTGNNITKITDNQQVKASYEYDQYSRLVKENDIHYSYDINGNIQQGDKFVYSGNQLIKFEGKEFQYDEIGNPTTYKDKPMQWDFRNLRQYLNVKFDYTASGIRTRKTAGQIVTDYDWAGSKLICEKRTKYHCDVEMEREGDEVGFRIPGDGFHIFANTLTLEYIHGSSGIIGFSIKDDFAEKKQYWFQKNALGDVIKIKDENGKIYAEYQYDAWGNVKILKDVDGIGMLNPIRYRSYYWDNNIQMYYLQSRWYDPTIMRFINMDIVGILDTTMHVVNGLNLYIYAANNPIMFYDPTGKFFWFIFIPILIIGGGVAADQIFNDGNITNAVVGAVGDIIVPNLDIIIGIGMVTLLVLSKGAAGPLVKKVLVKKLGSSKVMSSAKLGTGIGGAFGGFGAAVNGECIVSGIGRGAFWGGVAGAASGALGAKQIGSKAFNFGAQIVGNAVIGGLTSITQQLFVSGYVDFDKVGFASVFGGIGGAAKIVWSVGWKNIGINIGLKGIENTLGFLR